MMTPPRNLLQSNDNNGKNLMKIRLSLILSASLVIMSVPAHALTLVCEISSRDGIGWTTTGGKASASIIESWSPKKQTHVLDLKAKTALYKGPGFKTKLNVVNDKTIQWNYVEDLTSKGKTKFSGVSFKYHYVRKNGKLMTKVDIGPGYRGIESAKGKCVEYK